MAFFNFFAKPKKTKCAVIKKEFQARAKHRQRVTDKLSSLEKIADTIDKRQREMVIQLDELDASISVDPRGQAEPLIMVADIVFDFFVYSKKDPVIWPQALMMWQGTMDALKKAGMEVLVPMGEPFNYNLHEAIGTTCEPGIPHGCVTDTLKCGYVQADRILRRAMVMVNKMDGGTPE